MRSRNLALREVKKRARKILRDHPALDEFVMAMGGAFFTTKTREKERSVILVLDDRAYFKPLDDFLCEWDRSLKLTGHPMRFTAHGKIVTDW